VIHIAQHVDLMGHLSDGTPLEAGFCVQYVIHIAQPFDVVNNLSDGTPLEAFV
jgi:hypothetical protein